MFLCVLHMTNTQHAEWRIARLAKAEGPFPTYRVYWTDSFLDGDYAWQDLDNVWEAEAFAKTVAGYSDYLTGPAEPYII